MTTPNETTEDGHTELVGSDALMAIERSQIDTQIATAKKYPRSTKAFIQEASGMIALNTDVAEGCNYKLKRKGRDSVVIIEGPSVRLLEIAASAYGNLKYGSRTIAIDEEFVTAQGVAFDLEKNVSSSVEVKRSIKSKSGRYSQDMIMVTANAAGAIARRNALNGIIPRVYIQTLADYAKKVALGDIKTLPERRQKAFDYFTKTIGVRLELVLAYLEKKSVEDCTLEDVGELQELKTALKEGTTTVEEVFSPATTTPTAGQKPPLDPPASPAAAQPKKDPPLPNDNKGPKPETKPAAATPPSSGLQNEGEGHIPDAKAAPSVTAEAGQQSGSDLKQTTGPTNGGSAKTAEQAAPNPSSADGAKEVAQPATSDSHAQIQSALDDRGASFDDFKDWLVNSGRWKDAQGMKLLTDLPADKAAEILAPDAKGARPLDRCLKIFGTK